MVVKERDVFERSVAFASLEYKEIKKCVVDYQKLYRFLVLEGESDVFKLSELMGKRLLGDVSQMKRVLLGYLKVLFGGSVDLGVVAESVCPSCFCRSLVDSSGGDGIRKVCSCCGLELDAEYGSFRDFGQNLDFDVTIKPVSQLSYTKVGGTFNPKERRNCPDHQGFLYNVVNRDNVLFSDFSVISPDIAKELEKGVSEVIKDGFVFCRMGDFVRRCGVEEFSKAKMRFWREFDSFLRASALMMNVKAKDILNCIGSANRVDILFKKENENDKKFNDCFELYPEIADKLVDEGVEVEYGGFVFCRIGRFVRRCGVEEFSEVKLKIWHELDAMLRKSKLEKQLSFKGDCSREKVYGLGLCRRFGFDNTNINGDQALYNTLGDLLEKYKPLVAMLDRRVSCEVFVGTVFFMCLLHFGYTALAIRVKSELRVDSWLVDFLGKVILLVSDANSR